jgi:hypothetical protein
MPRRAWASTNLAAKAVASAPPDGHTLLFTFDNTFSLNPQLFRNLPYRAEDFAPFMRVLSVPWVQLVSAGSTLRKRAGLLREAKARQGETTWASAGIATGFPVVMAHAPHKDCFMPDAIAQRIVDARGFRAVLREVSPTMQGPGVRSCGSNASPTNARCLLLR